MDFFEAQAQAKKRTGRLLVLFSFAVIGTVAAGYVAALLIQILLRSQGADQLTGTSIPTSFWQGRLFLTVTGVTLLVIGLASLGKWLSFRQGGEAVARMMGADYLPPRSSDVAEQRLLNVVEEMAIASGCAVPAVFVMRQEDSINAFAAGLTPQDAVVAVSQGALDRLSRDELQAVVAHEFSHILNGDMRLNVRLACTLFGILVIGIMGQTMLRGLRYMRFSSGRSSGGNKKGGAGGIVLVYLAIAVALFVIGYVGYFFGRLIQSAVSRQREFLADASAVQFTRNPDGMCGALKQIVLQDSSPELNTPQAAQIGHFFFSQGVAAKFSSAFATHPPLRERIGAIDPEFMERTAKQKPRQRRRAPPKPPPVPTATVTGALPPILPTEASPAMRVLEPAVLLASIGDIDHANTDHAQQLLESIGDGLRGGAREAALAEPLIYALLTSREAELSQKQRALLPEDLVEATTAFQPQIHALPPDSLLPLAQLCLVGLRQLSPTGQERLHATMQDLIDADGEQTLYEHALRSLVRHDLRTAHAPTLNTGSQIHSFAALAQPASRFLSILAHVGSDTAEQAVQAFAAAKAQLPMKLAYQPQDEQPLDQLEPALDRLALASPPIKKRIVAAACAIVAHDGKAHLREIELLRLCCANLDVPMPPVPPSESAES